MQDLPFCRCYIDDIIIWSNSMEQHSKNLEEVCKRLCEASLKVHPGKCMFAADSIDFLRHRKLLGDAARQVGSNPIPPLPYIPF